MRLVAYIRVSKVGGRSGDSFQSPKQQRDAIVGIVNATPGAEIVREFVDLDESGGKMSRPGFDEALAMVFAGEADGIVVAKVDRFARSNQGITVIKRLADQGKAFISAQERFDTSTSMGRFALAMMVLVAELQREQFAEAWAVTTSNAIGRGVSVSLPFGYRRGPDGRLEPDEPAASAVRMVFALRDTGLGVAAVADAMNEAGVPAPRGGQWTRQSVRALLRVVAYSGSVAYGDQRLDEAHEPLVDPLVWERCQPARGREWSRSRGLLDGLVRCEGCGYVMGPGATKTGRRYSCGRNHSTGRCPSPTTCNADRLEDLVVAALLERHGDMAAVGGDDSAATDATGMEERRAHREYVAWRDDTEMRGLLGEGEYRAGLLARKRAWDAAGDAHEEAVRSHAASSMTISREQWDALAGEGRRLVVRTAVRAVWLGRAASTATPLTSRARIVWASESDDGAFGRGPVGVDGYPRRAGVGEREGTAER